MIEPTPDRQPQAAQDLSDDPLCAICLALPITHALLPCGHRHFCGDCAAMLVAGAATPMNEEPRCPLCRGLITSSESTPEEAPAVPLREHQAVIRHLSPIAAMLQSLSRGRSPGAAVQDNIPYAVPLPQSQQLQRPPLAVLPGPVRSPVQQLAQLSQSSAQRSTESSTAPTPTIFGPWWPDTSEAEQLAGHYSTKPQLDDDEVGLLPDTGAHDNLAGSIQARRQAEAAVRHGRTPEQHLLDKQRRVAGVGNGSQTCTHEVVLPVSLQATDGRFYEETFCAPCVDESQVPLLWGIQSLKKKNAVIACKEGVIYLMGPGGYEIKPSPGSLKFQMKESRAGHWMVPISNFSQHAQTTQSILHARRNEDPDEQDNRECLQQVRQDDQDLADSWHRPVPPIPAASGSSSTPSSGAPAASSSFN